MCLTDEEQDRIDRWEREQAEKEDAEREAEEARQKFDELLASIPVGEEVHLDHVGRKDIRVSHTVLIYNRNEKLFDKGYQPIQVKLNDSKGTTWYAKEVQLPKDVNLNIDPNTGNVKLWTEEPIILKGAIPVPPIDQVYGQKAFFPGE